MSSIARKQISIVVPLEDWKVIRRAAAECQIPMTELCRRWMEQSLQRLRDSPLIPEDFEDQVTNLELRQAALR